MSDKMREDFEKWVVTFGWLTDRDEDGYYDETPTQMAWNAWQASRQALAVELPIQFGNSLGRGVFSCESITGALDKVGIRYE